MPKISSDAVPMIIVIAFGAMGLILAAIEKVLVDNGYLLDEYIAESITLPDLQIVTIIFALLIGVLCAAITAR